MVMGILASVFGALVSFFGTAKMLASIRDMIIATGDNHTLLVSISNDIIAGTTAFVFGMWLLIYGAVKFATLKQQ
jgi:hypothetical protein